MSSILITGAGGFIGSHLAERCIELGYDVIAFVRYNSMNSWGWLDHSIYKNEINIFSGDIRDYDGVCNAMRGCNAVFHLAALIGIPYSYVSPFAYLKTNIEGCYNILQAARAYRLENILITSTSETYGTAQYIPIDENHPLVGQSPYSASKIAADHLAISYYLSFGLPIKIVRPFNTYGPRQSARSVIPTIISQILAGKKVIRLGNLSPTRDFTFVKDTVNGFIEILKSDNLYGEVTNIGMNKEISIGELAKTVSRLMNINIEIVSEDQRIRPDGSEVERLRCNNLKIIEKTNWLPQYSLEKGLIETIEFIKENLENYKCDIYNI